MATGFTHTVLLKITLVVCKTSQQNMFVTVLLPDGMSLLNNLHTCTCMRNQFYQLQSLVTNKHITVHVDQGLHLFNCISANGHG